MRAFVLFGNFLWPPVATLTQEDQSEERWREGAVEVHLWEDFEAGLAPMAFRWRPRASLNSLKPAGEEEFDLPKDSLFSLSLKEAQKRFAELPEDAELAFLIDRGDFEHKVKSGTTEPWLSFRGGFLLDQYDEASNRTLRWPLVRRCEYVDAESKKTISVHSTFGVGLVGVDNPEKPVPYFRFNMHLPLPLARTTHGNVKNATTFPFAAVFHPKKTIDETLKVSSLVGGWVGYADAEGNKEGVSFILKDFDKLRYRRLGAFDLAAVANDGGAGGFVGYATNQVGTLSNYWPHTDSAVHCDLLARFGFSVTERPTDLNITSPQDLSLRFRPAVNGCKYIYRVGVVPGKAKTGTNPQIVGGVGSTWQFRLEEETGGTVAIWKETKSRLAVDAELSWDISDEDIWSEDKARDWSPRLRLVLHSESVFNLPQTAGATLSDGLLSNGKASLGKARSALFSLEGAEPRSFLPTLASDKSKGNTQTVRFGFYSPRLPLDVDDDGQVSWKTPARRVRLRMTLVDLKDLIEAERPKDNKDNELRLIASEMTFFETPGRQAKLTLKTDISWIPETTEEIAQGAPYFASYTITPSEGPSQGNGQSWTGRLGGLQFEGGGIDLDHLGGHLRLGGPGALHQTAFGAPVVVEPEFLVAAQLKLGLRATGLSDVSAPVARRDRSGRRGPVVIPDLSDPAAQTDGKGQYDLWVTESVAPAADRLLEAQIFAQTPSAGNQTYTILNEAPLSIFRFTRLPIDARGDASTVEVGVYSSEDRVFQYRPVSDTYHYVLPPQSIGESADKPGRLEIHDSSGSLPYLSNESIPLRQHAVQFRLTPPAEIWIRPSDVERGYFLPEAMTYELFRQTGGLGIGAALAFLRAEFLYGLPVGISTGAEQGPARAARVAEIEALTGRVRGPVSPEAMRGSLDRDLGRRWQEISDAVARRPERLDIWEPGPGDGVAFPPARFSNGASFALRRTALLRKPVLAPSEVEGEVEEPGSFGLPLRFHPQGIAGGVLWPVEQAALLEALAANPSSDGGVIERIALSPFGGDAGQKVRLLNGIVTITSLTINGRVQRHTVEVLGRIRAFWHRAKHVVVYERTASPSAQFAPKVDGPPNGTRSRRPILRKVSEYIELLQPERSYPDSPVAQAQSAGFLRRVRFNTILIPVDSAWAQEVRSSGGKPGAWTMPLWNRHAAKERPQVYTMPDIAFVTAGEGEEEQPETIQQCLDPDMFDFFADFGETTDQTDLWPARTGIDYPMYLPGGPLIAAVDAVVQDDDPARRRPAVSRVLPGLRGFTWRLAPAAQKTMINAGRSDQPVYVGLESVTFMRGGAAVLADEASGALVDIVKAAKPGEAAAFWTVDGPQGPAAGATFSKGFEDLVTALGSKQQDKAETALNTLKLTLQTHESSINKVAKAAADALGKNKFTELLKDNSDPCDALKVDAVAAIRAKRMLIGTAIADWVAEADGLATLLEVAGKVWTKADLIAEIVDGAKAKVTPFFTEATRDVARLREGIEKARAVVGTVGEDAAAVVARALARVREVHDAYDRAKPWSPQRLNSVKGDLDAAIIGFADDIGVAVEEARQRLAVELGAAGQSVFRHVAGALEGVAKAAKGAVDTTAAVNDAFDKTANDVLAQFDALLSADEKIGKLPEAKAKIADARKKLGKLDEEKKKIVEGALNTAEVRLEAAIKTVRDARTGLEAAKGYDKLGEINAAIALAADGLTSAIADAGLAAGTVIEAVKDLTDGIADGIKGEVDGFAKDLQEQAQEVFKWLAGSLSAHGKFADALVEKTVKQLDGALTAINGALTAVGGVVDTVGNEATQAVGEIEKLFAPDKMAGFVANGVLRPVVTRLLEPLPDSIDTQGLAEVRRRLDSLSAEVTQALSTAEDTILEGLQGLSNMCSDVFETVADVTQKLQAAAQDAENWLKKQISASGYGKAVEALEKVIGDANAFAVQAEALAEQFSQAEDSARELYNSVTKTVHDAKAYSDRVLDLAANIGKGGLSAAPSNVLKLYSAVSSPPEIAALKSNLDKMRAEFDELESLIKTTPAAALFGKLGDAMKGMDISLPFDGIADRLTPPDLSKFDIGKVFGGFGGARLKNLLKGVKLPKGVEDSVRLTHGFDKKAARAWVQIDIDAKMPGRKALFTFGPFKSDFLNTRLVGQVRFEVSKDTPEISETGYGRIETTIDMGVSGQSIVKFENFALAFSREAGLDVQFDPKGIRLNPQFRMIQEFMETIFPDEVGGIEILKQDNIPVGLKHVFMTPPIGANAITSGVTNIAIGNTFALRAYPDFELSNTFNLASEEQPFIFSIFILGCTGYMSAGVSYLPIVNRLAVTVKAAVGGSAQLAIDIGPFNGAVYITLSGVLTYSKSANASGGALTIGMTLVIAGSVRVMGMVTVMISVVLRLSYQDNGRIDASGTLSVTIRISRFFKIRARAGVKYTLKDGKSQTTVSSSVKPEGELVEEAKKKAQVAKSTLDKLKKVTAGGMS